MNSFGSKSDIYAAKGTQSSTRKVSPSVSAPPSLESLLTSRQIDALRRAVIHRDPSSFKVTRSSTGVIKLLDERNPGEGYLVFPSSRFGPNYMAAAAKNSRPYSAAGCNVDPAIDVPDYEFAAVKFTGYQGDSI